MTGHLLALASAAVALALARRRRWLTGGGAWAATAVGAAVWGGVGPAGVGLLVLFFVSSSALSRLPRRRAVRPDLTGGAGEASPSAGPGPGAGEGGAGGRPRSARQVLANGGVAAAAAVLPGAFAPAAVVGALAAATADTWSSEVGEAVGGSTRLVTTGQRVPPGTPGGLSLAGSVAGLAGGAAIGGAAWMLGLAPAAEGWARLTATGLAAGASGAGLDSVLGATAEGRPGWLDNDGVNLVATAAGAAVAAGLAPGAP